MLVAQIGAKIDLETTMGIWLFDENRGTVATDVSGNNNRGETQGAEWVQAFLAYRLSESAITTRVVTPLNFRAVPNFPERTEHPAIQLFGKNDLQVVVQGKSCVSLSMGPRSGKSPIATIPQDGSALLWKIYNK